MFPRNNFWSMLHELLIIHCTNSTSITNPFTFIKYRSDTVAKSKGNSDDNFLFGAKYYVYSLLTDTL